MFICLIICLYVYMYIYIYTDMYMYISKYIYICIRIYTALYVEIIAGSNHMVATLAAGVPLDRYNARTGYQKEVVRT